MFMGLGSGWLPYSLLLIAGWLQRPQSDHVHVSGLQAGTPSQCPFFQIF
jgi:hypothetical protein